MILSAQTLQKLQPLEPFCPRTKHNGLTYGLGPAGYDVRISQDLRMGGSGLHDRKSFALASTIECFNMPFTLLGQVCDKSTWARRGIAVQNTIIEPGWRGHLTLEITCHVWDDVDIFMGDPIAQIIFFWLDRPTQLPYDGKYQDQKMGAQEAIFEKDEPANDIFKPDPR